MFQGLNITTDLNGTFFLIQKVELLKMASKMAVSYATKTCMTDILDKNTFNLIFMDV